MPTFPSLARFGTRIISYLVIYILGLMGMGRDPYIEVLTAILIPFEKRQTYRG